MKYINMIPHQSYYPILCFLCFFFLKKIFGLRSLTQHSRQFMLLIQSFYVYHKFNHPLLKKKKQQQRKKKDKNQFGNWF